MARLGWARDTNKKENMNNPDYLSVAEAAAYLKVSEKSIRRWIASGRLTARRAGPRLIRIDPRSLERMMETA